MKLTNFFSSAALTIGCVCAVVSCQKTNFVKGGDTVIFTFGQDGSETDTKASYGGTEYTSGGKNYEYIHWSQGDVVTVYCSQGSTYEAVEAGQAGDGKWADYVVDEVNSSDKTLANIVLNSATTKIGLRWNEDETKQHNFWAVYPSAAMGGIGRAATKGFCNNRKAVYGNLKSSQNTLTGALSGSEATGYVLKPDMKWMLMYGYKKNLTRANFPSTGSVFIKFKPLTTAIQFTITNSVSRDLVIKELDLISTSKQIFGSFDISDVTTTASDGFPAANFKTPNVSNNTVKLELNPSVTIKQGKTFTFTFFLAPVADADDLKFRIVRDETGNPTMTTRLGYTDGTYIKFGRCKKHFVTGIMVPEGVQWTIDYEPVLTEWEDGDNGTGGTDVNLN